MQCAHERPAEYPPSNFKQAKHTCLRDLCQRNGDSCRLYQFRRNACEGPLALCIGINMNSLALVGDGSLVVSIFQEGFCCRNVDYVFPQPAKTSPRTLVSNWYIRRIMCQGEDCQLMLADIQEGRGWYVIVDIWRQDNREVTLADFVHRISTGISGRVALPLLPCIGAVCCPAHKQEKSGSNPSAMTAACIAAKVMTQAHFGRLKCCLQGTPLRYRTRPKEPLQFLAPELIL